MSKNRKHRTRRLRRTQRQVLRFGPRAKAKHKSKSGRTGRVHATKMKSLTDAAARTQREVVQHCISELRVLASTPAPSATDAKRIVERPHPSTRGVEKLPPEGVMALFREAGEQMADAKRCATCGGSGTLPTWPLSGCPDCAGRAGR